MAAVTHKSTFKKQLTVVSSSLEHYQTPHKQKKIRSKVSLYIADCFSYLQLDLEIMTSTLGSKIIGLLTYVGSFLKLIWFACEGMT